MTEIVRVILAGFFLAFTPPANSADPPSVVKSIRMTQLEDKFNVKIVGILRTPSGDFWVFMEHQDGTLLNMFPVVIKKDASNHDMEVARVAAENVASFYESEMLKAKAHPSPAGTTFTMPAHPPQVAQR